jgi:hypothetical protein
MRSAFQIAAAVGAVISLGIVDHQNAGAAQPGDVLVFEGTVTSIKVIHHELTPWLVTLTVEKVLSGELSGPTFSFAVHSPAMSGLAMGRSYTVRAEWKDGGYFVDPLQWRRSKSSGPRTPLGKQELKPVGTKLLKDVDASPRTFLVGKNKKQGLGEYSVQVDGKYVWPPAGEGCESFIACCTELTARKAELSLACQLAIGRDGACSTAKDTVRQIAGEHGLTPPPACTQ